MILYKILKYVYIIRGCILFMVEYKFVQTLLYKSDEGAIEGDFIIGEDTLWANQKVVSEIFGTTSQNISQHFNNIIQDEELIENEVCLSSKELFGDNPEFIKKNFKKSNNRGRPQIIIYN